MSSKHRGAPLRQSGAGYSGTQANWGICSLAILTVLCLLVAGSMSRAQAPPRVAKKAPNSPGKSPGADLKPAAVFVKFPDWVASVAFAPDGKTLAAGSYGVVKLLDVAEKQELATLPEPAGFVKAVRFSADGKTLVTGSYQSLLVWDVASRKVIHKLKGHRGYVTSVAFSPDEKTLVSACDDETVRLWDAFHRRTAGNAQGDFATGPGGRLFARRKFRGRGDG